MIFDIGDVVRIRSGSGSGYEQTLVFIVRSVNLTTCSVGVRCVNNADGIPAPTSLPFSAIELMEV